MVRNSRSVISQFFGVHRNGVTSVVRGAASVNEDLLTPPQAYRNVPITKAEMAGLLRSADRRLVSYYTGSLLTNWRAIAGRTLDANHLHAGKTDAWLTNWRVDWAHLGELTPLPRDTETS